MEDLEFEKLVNEAIASLPEKVREIADNLAVTIERSPTQEQLQKIGVRRGSFLLGLYEGVPKTAWGRGFGMNLPDKITIFQQSIENFCRTPEEVKKMAADVVWHEVAHHFGFDEKEIHTLEKERKAK